MGGRGEFLKSGGSGILPEDRKYTSIGTLDGIKILKNPDNHAPQPPYSNTAGTKYFTIGGKHEQIKHISYYNKEHEIYRSVDIDLSGRGMHHAHIWDKNKGGRPSHDPAHESPLTNRDKHYLKLALEYNKTHSK